MILQFKALNLISDMVQISELYVTGGMEIQRRREAHGRCFFTWSCREDGEVEQLPFHIEAASRISEVSS